jgi:O-antigen/teichoic acid export membrane protein
MQKKFLSSLLLIIVLNLLIKPLAIFGIDASVQNRVGASAYGLYFSLLNLSFLFNIVLDVGINNYTTKNIAQYPHLVGRYWGKIMSFRLILFFLYAALTLIMALVFGYDSNQLMLLGVLVFNQLLVTLIAFVRSHFGGLHLFKTDAIISVLDRLLLIFICGAVLFTNVTDGEFQIEWFIWMQTVAYALTAITAFALLIQKTGLPKFRLNKAFSFAILRKSYPYALLILLMMIYTRTDSVMLERIHPNGAYEAGVYAQGFRLLDALFMFGMIFANLLLPIFARMLKQKSTDLEALLNQSRNLLVGGAILIGFVCHSNATEILSLIYENNVTESVPSFQLLMWCFIAMSISLIYGTLLTAGGNLKFLNRISLVGVLANIGVNLYLIPIYGATGAALATIITQSLTALAQLIYAHQFLKLIFPMKTILHTLVFVAWMLLMIQFIPSGNYLLFSQIILGTALLFLHRFIDLKSIVGLLKREEI